VTRAPLTLGLALFATWLSTLGACGRTSPLVEDTYGYAASGDEDIGLSGGTGGKGSASGGTNATGGSANGSSQGGTSTGGSSRGGTSTGGSSRGGSTSQGGSVAVGGGPSVGGSQIDTGGTGVSGGRGGTTAVGGGSDGGFTSGGTSLGGSSLGGSSSATGGTGADGGTGARGGSAGMGGMMVQAGITCGNDVCDPSTSICCQMRSMGSVCQSPDERCQGATLECSGPGSCDPGEVCCYHARRSACQATCNVSEGNSGNPPTILLCDSTADCGPNQTCVVSPRGVAYCGDNL
jgi:hypothetical protein